MAILLRHFRESDIADVVSGWNNCFPYDRTTREQFAQIVLGDPNYKEDGHLVVVSGKHVVGFVSAIAREGIAGKDGIGKPEEKDTGYIKALLAIKRYPTEVKAGLLNRALYKREYRVFKKNLAGS